MDPNSQPSWSVQPPPPPGYGYQDNYGQPIYPMACLPQQQPHCWFPMPPAFPANPHHQEALRPCMLMAPQDYRDQTQFRLMNLESSVAKLLMANFPYEYQFLVPMDSSQLPANEPHPPTGPYSTGEPHHASALSPQPSADVPSTTPPGLDNSGILKGSTTPDGQQGVLVDVQVAGLDVSTDAPSENTGKKPDNVLIEIKPQLESQPSPPEDTNEKIDKEDTGKEKTVDSCKPIKVQPEPVSIEVAQLKSYARAVKGDKPETPTNRTSTLATSLSAQLQSTPIHPQTSPELSPKTINNSIPKASSESDLQWKEVRTKKSAHWRVSRHNAKQRTWSAENTKETQVPKKLSNTAGPKQDGLTVSPSAKPASTSAKNVTPFRNHQKKAQHSSTSKPRSSNAKKIDEHLHESISDLEVLVKYDKSKKIESIPSVVPSDSDDRLLVPSMSPSIELVTSSAGSPSRKNKKKATSGADIVPDPGHPDSTKTDPSNLVVNPESLNVKSWADEMETLASTDVVSPTVEQQPVTDDSDIFCPVSSIDTPTRHIQERLAIVSPSLDESTDSSSYPISPCLTETTVIKLTTLRNKKKKDKKKEKARVLKETEKKKVEEGVKAEKTEDAQLADSAAADEDDEHTEEYDKTQKVKFVKYTLKQAIEVYLNHRVSSRTFNLPDELGVYFKKMDLADMIKKYADNSNKYIPCTRKKALKWIEDWQKAQAPIDNYIFHTLMKGYIEDKKYRMVIIEDISFYGEKHSVEGTLYLEGVLGFWQNINWYSIWSYVDRQNSNRHEKIHSEEADPDVMKEIAAKARKDARRKATTIEATSIQRESYLTTAFFKDRRLFHGNSGKLSNLQNYYDTLQDESMLDVMPQCHKILDFDFEYLAHSYEVDPAEIFAQKEKSYFAYIFDCST